MSAIKVENISKSFGTIKALDNVSFEVKRGELFGLIGPDGAGKTTLIHLLVNNLFPQTGSILWCGTEITTLGNQYRNIIGYKPQQQSIYPEFSVEDFLYYIACLKDIPKNQQKKQILPLLNQLHLMEHRRKKMKALSGGMLQRALLAQALLGNPKFLILDEPTAGLDPLERINMRHLISELSHDKIVLLATHIIEDIASIASEILFMNQGKILLRGDMPTLKEYYLKGKAAGNMNTVFMQDEILVLENLYSNLFHRQ